MRSGLSFITAVAIGISAGVVSAEAAVNLKKVNIVDGNQIELLFDGKVETSQVKTEFVRDNIQLSLTNTSVYPAKVSMVSGSDLTKVFAYQYAPSLVRARFTVRGDAASYANRLQVKIVGKIVTIKISNVKTDQVPTAASSALRTVSTPEKSIEVAKPAPAPVTASAESEKKGLFDRITASDRAEAATEKSVEKNPEKADKSEKSDKADKSSERRLAAATVTTKSGKESLTSGKSLPSPFRSIGVMLFVLGLFGLFVMFLKRLKAGDKSSLKTKGIGGFLSKLSGAGNGKAMIEVVATHHLAPKRSIVVVRVQDRMLVLGMTNDAVNLITEFKAGEDGEADENVEINDFAASLKKFENETPVATPNLAAKAGPRANLGDIAAAALGLAKPKPISAPRANAAATAYQSTQTGSHANGTGATAAGGPAFSPALAAALAEPSVKPSIRAQIKDRVQGMKQL